MCLLKSYSVDSQPTNNSSLKNKYGLPQYNHEYHTSLVYKIFCADKGNAEKVEVNFEEALNCIHTIHDITGGIKQIVYLVGWQFDGHDSKYPAWSEVNHRLKRVGDPDARTSFIWLANEAKKYNALVSVHINMSDAYMNSPLWDEYLKNGLIILNKDGTPTKGGIWGGEQSYSVDKMKEWELGYSQKRIDNLLKLLPFIKENGTVHIDALGMTEKNVKLLNAVNGIIDYMHNKGVDVTTEYFDFNLAGRIPYVYHLNLAEENRLKYPPNIICGGGPGGNMRNLDDRGPYYVWATLPDAGCLFDEAWGISIDNDLSGKDMLKNIVGRICTRTLQWYFLNSHHAVSNYQDTANYRVAFSDEINTNVHKSNRYLTIRQGDRLLVDGDFIFMPALWTKGEWWAYNKNGGTHTWPIPKEWQSEKVIEAIRLTNTGRGEKFDLPVKNGKITIDLLKGEALALSAK